MVSDKIKHIVVLVSGGGTNLQRIIDGINHGDILNTKISLVVADRACYGLTRAEEQGIPNVLINRGKNFCENLEKLLPENVDLIVLAGFLSIISGEFAEKFSGKMINIHPSLLPKFGGKGMWGMNVHNAVIASGEKESGATVHFVTTGIDEGGIVLQEKVKVEQGDTAETLAEKIHQVEYNILPKAIKKLLKI